MIDDVARRNRRRMILFAGAAATNAWVVLAAFAWLLLLGFVPEPPFPLAVPALVGAVAAAGLGAWAVRGARARTVRRLGAVELSPGDLPVVTNLLDELGLAVGTPPVRAALLDDPAPNALAAGHRPGATTIVVTTGLVEVLRRDELEAVLAAELWAVRRLDTALQTVAVACTRAATAAHLPWRDGAWSPSSLLALLATWPTMVFAEALRRSVHAEADLGADALAVATTRNPDGLRRALVRLRDDPRTVAVLEPASAALWFEPVPHDDRQRAPEFRRVALAPSLEQRLARLGTGGAPAS